MAIINKKIVFGTYVPLQSVIHRLDPRVKLYLCIWYVVIIFLANNLWTSLWLFFALVITMKLSRVSFRQYWQGVLPLFWIILLTSFFQVFFAKGGTVYWHWGIMAITSSGIKNSLIIFYRFMVIILASTVLTATTPTLRITDSLDWYMRPLSKIKVPVNQITLVMSIALRFIPTIMDETTKITNAQRSRGMNFSKGGLIQRIRRLNPIIVPLFTDAFKRAEELAVAMEARGYDPDSPRSHYRQLHWHRRDTTTVIISILVTVGLVVLRKIWDKRDTDTQHLIY